MFCLKITSFGPHKVSCRCHEVSFKSLSFVATYMAGDVLHSHQNKADFCPEVSLKLCSGFTLTDVKTQSRTVVTGWLASSV